MGNLLSKIQEYAAVDKEKEEGHQQLALSRQLYVCPDGLAAGLKAEG